MSPLIDWLLDGDPADPVAGAARPHRRPARRGRRRACPGRGRGVGRAPPRRWSDDDGQWAGGACFPAGFDGDVPPGSPGRRRCPRCCRCATSASTRRRPALRAIELVARATAAGSTPGSRSSTARSSRASTAARRDGRLLRASTSPASSTRLLGEQLDGRRLELRGRERLGALVLRHDDLRARRPARSTSGLRARPRRSTRAAPGRGVPAAAAAVPAQEHRRGGRRRRSSTSRSRPTGTTTCCAASTTSARSAANPMPGWRRPWTSSGPSGSRTARGRWRTRTRAPSTSRIEEATARPAGGTPCGRSGCCAGATAAPPGSRRGTPDGQRVLPVWPRENRPGCGHTHRPCGRNPTGIFLSSFPVAVSIT